ncbi:hypothetical protein ABZ341_29365 [Streptomyces sp. NPDC006173]|uniref:hypothetical protein n=1 Tax=Streptomyces sp. NPDC006173 TaxID=3155349 RepID=UPI0034100B34
MMEKLSDFLTRHLWFQFALSWLAATAVVLLIYPGRSVPGVLVRVVVTSVGALWVALRIRSREKRAAGGSTDGLVALERQLRTGEVPVEPERREAMRELVDRRAHRTRHRGAALVFLFLLFGGVVVLTALTAGPRQTIRFGLLTVAFLTWAVVGGGRGQRRLRHMRDLLAAAPDAAGPDRSAPNPGGPGLPASNGAAPGRPGQRSQPR